MTHYGFRDSVTTWNEEQPQVPEPPTCHRSQDHDWHADLVAWRRLTAMITSEPVTASCDQFALSSLQSMGSRLGNRAVNDGQPDTFLGGRYCIRHTFVLGGGTGSAVRSDYRWAGVVAGYGIQVFVLGTRTIINAESARRLMDYVLLIPPS